MRVFYKGGGRNLIWEKGVNLNLERVKKASREKQKRRPQTFILLRRDVG